MRVRDFRQSGRSTWAAPLLKRGAPAAWLHLEFITIPSRRLAAPLLASFPEAIENAAKSPAAASSKAQCPSPQPTSPCPPASNRHHRPKAVVIGAGPSGLVAAAALAMRGCSVEVHERRMGPPNPSADSRHAINIVLHQKGLRAISSVGIDISHLARFPLNACVRHMPPGSLAPPMEFLRPKVGRARSV